MSASGTGRTLGLPHDVASRESAEDSALVGISDEEEGNEGLEDTRLRSLHRTGLGSSRRFHSPSPLLDDRSQAFSASQCLRSLSRSGGHRSIKIGVLAFSGATAGGVTILMEVAYPKRAPYPEDKVAEALLLLQAPPSCRDVSGCGIGGPKTAESQINMFGVLDDAGAGTS
eukprot:g15118.t2